MDTITYAKKNNLPLNIIPPSNVVNAYLVNQIAKKSRQKYLISYDEPEIPIDIRSTYPDAETGRIEYASPFEDSFITDFIDAQTNLLDKFLALNPKQIGIVNPYIDISFDYNNQLHYLVCKKSIIPLFENNNDDDARMPLNKNKILFFDENNKTYTGYGNINLNNILFASLLYKFSSTGFELDLLTFNNNLSNLTQIENIKSIPYITDYSKNVTSVLSGSFLTYENQPIEYSIDELSQTKNKTTQEYTVNFVTGSAGLTVIESPLNFSAIKSIYNENLIIDRTHPLWTQFKVTLQKDIHYSTSGNDISYLNPVTNLSILDDILKSIYSWKSCLIIFEKENKLWDSTSTLKPRYTYEFALLVGIKTRKYKLTEKIENLFYITAGDNYINNDKFSKKDIFFIKSSVKKMLNVYKPDRVHFFDLSNSDYGNICKNGLLFGMESELQTSIINFINKKDNQFVKTSSKIENLYELFEQL